MTGLLVQRVEPMSAAHDAGIERGQIILEINRQPVHSVAGFRRVLSSVRPGDAMAVFIYIPDIDQKNIRTVRMDRALTGSPSAGDLQISCDTIKLLVGSERGLVGAPSALQLEVR